MAEQVALIVKLNADGSNLVAALDDAEKSFKKLERSGAQVSTSWGKTLKDFANTDVTLKAVGKTVGAVSVAFTAAATALGYFVAKGLDANEALAKQSRLIGISAQTFRGLQHAAELAGGSAEQLEGIARRLANNLQAAQVGGSEAARSFGRLHLNAREMLSLPFDKQLVAVAKALDGVKNATDRAAFATDLLGRGGFETLNTLHELAKGTEEVDKKVLVAFGGTIDEMAIKSERANDAMKDLQLVFEGFQGNLAGKFAPLIEHISQRLFAFVEANGGMAQVAEAAYNAIVNGAVRVVGFMERLVDLGRLAGIGFQIFGNAAQQAFLGIAAVDNYVAKNSPLLMWLIGGPDAQTVSNNEQFITEQAAALQAEMLNLGNQSRAIIADMGSFSERMAAFIEEVNQKSTASAKKEIEQQRLDREASLGVSMAAEETQRLEEQKHWETLKKQHYDRLDAERKKAETAAAKAASDAARISEKAAAEALKAQEDAAKQTAEFWINATSRIDAAFADAFKGAYGSFSEFADSLKEGFKQLLGELANAAITKPITLYFQQAMAGMGVIPGASGGGAGGGIGGSVLGGGSGSATSILGALKGGASGLLMGANSTISGGSSWLINALAQGGYTGSAQFLAQGLANTTVLGNQVGSALGIQGGGAALGGLVTAGGGLVGGWAGGQIGSMLTNRVPQDNGLLSAAGGLGGAAIGAQYGAWGGPIGAAIGAAIGAIAASVTGKDVKGQRVAIGVNAGGGASTQLGTIGSVVGSSGLVLTGTGRRASDYGMGDVPQQLLDAFKNIDDVLTSTARAAGLTVDFTGRTLSNPRQGSREQPGSFFGSYRKGEINAEDIKAAAGDFITVWIRELGDQVPDRVRKMIAGVGGPAEDIANAFQAALSIDKLIDLDVVKETDKALEALGKANRTLLEQYRDATIALDDIGQAYDGSLASIQKLNEALTNQKLIAVELASAYKVVGANVSATFSSAIEQIQESILNDEQLYTLRRSQIADLTEQLGQTIDPDKINAITQQIDQLSKSAFGLLDDTQKQGLASQFVDFLTQAAGIAQSQVSAGLGSLGTTEASVQQTINMDLQRAQMDQATTQQFADAVADFSNLPQSVYDAIRAAMAAGSFRIGEGEVNVG